MHEATRTFQDSETPRFRWTVLESGEATEDDGADVVAGLIAEPKILPPRYFYDARGSQLFERICTLEEYYPTRTEEAILDACATEIAAIVGPCELLELGSGSARKTRVLIEALSQRGRAMRFTPIDVSAEILKQSSRTLLRRFPEIEITGLIGTYEEALAGLPASPSPTRLLIFLGSTIGNLTNAEYGEFLGDVRRALDPGDHFLVGFDLQKSPAIIEAAYNDAAGVTADFNLNMLRHLNARFDGDFEPDAFAHYAFYNREESRIEMHLRSTAAQQAALRALDLDVAFAADETVRTEISRKFYLPDVAADFAAAGFDDIARWTDPKSWFGVVLFRAS